MLARAAPSTNFTLDRDTLGRTNPARADRDRPGRRELPDLSDAAPGSRVELARDLRATVRAWTEVPTSIGLGPTKPCLRGAGARGGSVGTTGTPSCRFVRSGTRRR
ncbi:hypothetical protein MFUR16E_18680 [Methylobacterium fujisawaense]